jgi:hypothetical protein
LFVTFSVHVIRLPRVSGFGLPVFVTARSIRGFAAIVFATVICAVVLSAMTTDAGE